MTGWEYKIIEHPPKITPEDLAFVLNGYGADGWDVTGFYQGINFLCAVLKRPTGKVSGPPKYLTPELISGCTASYYGLTIEDLQKKSRQKRVVQARHMAIFLSRDLLSHLSWSDISRAIGNQDPGTAINAYKNIRDSKDEKVHKAIEDITEDLKRLTSRWFYHHDNKI